MSEMVSIGNAILWHGDANDILQTLPRDGIIVSDPPYGIGYVRGHKIKTGVYAGRQSQNKNAGVRITGDDRPFDPAPLLKFREVLIWGADHFYPRLPDRGRWLAWNKLGPFESWDSFCDVEFAWHSAEGPARIFSMTWKGLACEKRGEENGIRSHPTQKPIRLMAWCLEHVGPGTVIDPYMGSGSTGVAALKLGRPFLGIELEKKYFDIACTRLERVARQPQLGLGT